MGNTSARWRRAALGAAASVLLAVVLAPSTAFAAKAATRIVVASQTVVDWSSGSSVAAPVTSVKLQKRSGAKWVALRGLIKGYYYDAETGAWTSVGSVTGSSITLTMASRGKYKLTYGGSSTAKPATSYTKRIDMIGDAIAPANVTFDTSDPTWIRVSVSYDVSWNTDAIPSSSYRPIEFGYWGSFEDNNLDDSHYSGRVNFYQQLWEPGTVQFSYRVRKSDVPSDKVGWPPTSFNTSAWFDPGDSYTAIHVSYTFSQDDSTPNPL
jgi:hypothetical protein